MGLDLGLDLAVEEAVEDGDEEALEAAEEQVAEQPHHLDDLVRLDPVVEREEEGVVDAEERHQHQRRLDPLLVPPRVFVDGRAQLAVQHQRDAHEQQQVDQHGDHGRDQDDQEDLVVLVGGPAEAVLHHELGGDPEPDDHEREPPSHDHVPLDAVAGVGEQSPEDQIVQVQSFHQDPGVVGRDAVLPQADDELARPVVRFRVDVEVQRPVLGLEVRGKTQPVDETGFVDEEGEGAQDKRREQMHMQDVPGAVQLPSTQTVKFDNTGADNTHLMKSMMLKATIRVTKDTT